MPSPTTASTPLLAMSPSSSLPEKKLPKKPCYICLEDFKPEDIIFTPPCHLDHSTHLGCRQKEADSGIDRCGVCRRSYANGSAQPQQDNRVRVAAQSRVLSLSRPTREKIDLACGILLMAIAVAVGILLGYFTGIIFGILAFVVIAAAAKFISNGIEDWLQL